MTRARDLSNRASDFVSVKDFGAVGNGVADDTAAIQAAVTACLSSKASLYVPAGSYKLTSQISVTLYDASAGRGLIVFGDGWGSKFIIDHTGVGFYVNCIPSYSVFQCEIRDLFFTDGTAHPNKIIHNDGAGNTLIERCIFEGATVTTGCVVNDNAYGLRIKNCSFMNIVGSGAVYNYTPSLSTYSYVNSIEGCDFSTLTTGIDVQGCNSFLITNTVFQECNKGFYANPITNSVYATNISFETCWFERNTTYDIELKSNTNYWCEASIKNCQFSGIAGINQCHIALEQKSRITAEGISTGNTVIVSGSANASATLIRATNFIQSGTFSWNVITPEGDITANSLTTPAASISSTGDITGSTFKSSSGSYAYPVSGTTVTLTTLPNGNDGTWLVTGCLSGTGSAISNSCVGVVATQNTNAVYTAIKTAANLTMSAVNQTSNTVTITIASPGVVTWTSHGLNNGDIVYFTTTGSLPTGLTTNTKYYVANAATNTFQVSSTLGNAVTISIASPAVITWNSHGLSNDDIVYFTTTGALPTGLFANTNYYVVNAASNTFQVSSTSGGAAINTFGSQSGTHICGKSIKTTGSQSGTHTCLKPISLNGNQTYTSLWSIKWTLTRLT